MTLALLRGPRRHGHARRRRLHRRGRRRGPRPRSSSPAEGVVGGFTLASRGFLGRRLGQVLPVDSIRSVGTHAVTIESTDVLADVESARRADHRRRRQQRRRHDGVGSGARPGQGRHPRAVVRGLASSASRSAADRLAMASCRSTRQRAVSGSTLIVPDGFENLVRTDLTGLAGEVENLERGGSS